MADFDLSNFKINVPQVAIEDYSFVIAGIPKVGKTALFASLIKLYFGDITKGLLFAFEKGYTALQDVPQDINAFDDFEEAVDQLVEKKEELPFKIIGIDTGDLCWDWACDAVIKEWNIKNPTKRTADISGVGAKGKSDQGFGVGYQRAKQKIRTQINRLMKAGYGVWVLTHSKDKEVEQRDGQKFDQLIVSMPSSAREIFINMADFIIFITAEKEKDKDTGDTVSKRYMYFRTDGYVEAGGRFTKVPERIEYNVNEFIEVFKQAVRAELEQLDKDIDEIAEEQQEEKSIKTKTYLEEQKKIKNNETTDSDTTTNKEKEDAEYTLEEMLTQLETKAKELRVKKVKPIDIKKAMNNNRNFDFVKDLDTAKQVMENLIALEQE